MSKVGWLYENGFGLPQDYARAREWYEKGAEYGDAISMRNLGALYYNGLGVAQDYAEAHKWYKRAADKGDARAMTNLGILYQNGQGVTQNYAKAREWFEMAAISLCAVAANARRRIRVAASPGEQARRHRRGRAWQVRPVRHSGKFPFAAPGCVRGG